MNLTKLVVSEALVPKLQSTTRNDALRELMDVLVEANAIDKSLQEQVTKKIIARENKATTGIGKGISLPHTSISNIEKPVAAIGLSAEGLDFKSLDNKPVHAVILIVSDSDKPDEHLSIMETVYKTIQEDQFRKLLFQSETSDEIYDLIEETVL